MSGRPGRPDRGFEKEFLSEAETLLEEAGACVDALEGAGDDPNPAKVNALFRAVHSLKGVAAMVGQAGISEGAHDLEAVLDGVRMGRVALMPPVHAAVRDGVAALSSLVGRVAAGEEAPALAERLAVRLEAAIRASAPARSGEAPVLPPEIGASLSDYEQHRVGEAVKRGKTIAFVDLDLGFDEFDVALRTAMAEAGAAGELIGTFPGTPSDATRMAFRLLVALPAGTDADALGARCGAREVVAVTRAPAPVAPAATDATADLAPQVARGTVRVPLGKVSALVDLAGELALARAALGRALVRALAGAPDRAARYEAQRAFAQLDRLVSALGPAALSLRLVPVEALASRLTRAFARTAAALGKEADFVVHGVETEIDKVLADELADPLLHVVRNALDHGIEAAEERAASGKPRRGRVSMSVAPRGREVVLTFSDDGRGIDGEAIVRTARERGILGPGDPDPLDPFSLLFRPGFSTARAVSEISGRGVGLDVVRENLGALGGRVAVRSTPGEGTTFEVSVPMTLVLLESLVVRVGDQRFAVPGENVLRTLEARAEDFEIVDGKTRLRDGERSLPLGRLDELLGIGPGAPRRDPLPVVVAEDGERAAAFVVDAVEGIWDLLVKPLGDSVPRLGEISGAAEVPGGEVALALDPGALVARLCASAPDARVM
ncbi:MAG: ATP-binding protein [Thermoanaerobaculia bacterium]